MCATGLSQEIVSVVLDDSQEKLVVKIPDLTPGANYVVSLNLISKYTRSIDLSQTKTGCGCIVVKSSDVLLKAGAEQQLDLSVQVPPSEKRVSFGKNVYLFESTQSKVPSLELQLQGTVVPWVTCQTPITIERTPGLEVQINATVERDGLNAHGLVATFPTNSKFEWTSSLEEKSRAITFRVRLKDRLIVAGGERWTEFVDLKSPDSDNPITLPIEFQLRRQINVMPKKAWERESGVVIFSVIGAVSSEHQFNVSSPNQLNTLFNFQVIKRSDSVRDFVVDLSTAIRADGSLAFDSIEFRWRVGESEWCPIVVPIVSLKGLK